MTYYNRTNTCQKVKEDGTVCEYSLELGPGHPHRELNKEGKWTGKWLCNRCHAKLRDKKKRHEEYRERYLTNRLTGNQDPNHSNTKGDMAEKLTNIWKGTEILADKTDNYLSPIDHTPHPITGLIYQTKSKWFDSINRIWKHHWESELSKNFDILILYCISEDGKTVERIYEFPKKDILHTGSICVFEIVKRGPHWYQRYRLTDEEEVKKVDAIWKAILEAK